MNDETKEFNFFSNIHEPLLFNFTSEGNDLPNCISNEISDDKDDKGEKNIVNTNVEISHRE